MTDEDGHLVLRTARERWRPLAIAVLALFGLPFAAAAVAAAVAGEWGIALLTGGVVAVPAIVIGAHLRCSRIVVTPDEIAVRGAVVRRRVPRARAVRVVRADLVQPRGPVVDTVFVLDADGRVLVRFHGLHHRRADIDRVVAMLGLPAGPSHVVTSNQLSALYPGIVPWHEAHPLRMVAYTVTATVVAVIVTAVALSSLASPT
jgi:hypothetical protein